MQMCYTLQIMILILQLPHPKAHEAALQPELAVAVLQPSASVFLLSSVFWQDLSGVLQTHN